MENTKPSQESQYALPLSLRYNLTVADAVPSSKNISQFLASNASVFTPSNNTIRIPVGSPAFLDLNSALLQLTFKNTSGAVCNLDGGADGLIRRCRIIGSDGQTIEELHEYGLLSSVLDQYTSSSGKRKVSAVLKGAPAVADDTPVFAAAAGTGPAGEVTNRGITIVATGATEMKLSSIGGMGYDQTQSDSLNDGISRKYLFSLKLGMFNLAANRLLPPGTNFVLELQLSDAANCIVAPAATTPSYEVQNVELHVPAIIINDASFNQRIASRMAQGMVFKANTYQHFVNVTPAGGTSDVLQISARARSLKSLMSIFRIQANITDKAQYSLSRRSIQYLDNYQARIGTTSYPVDRVNVACTGTPLAGGTANGTLPIQPTDVNVNISEAYSQALRVFGSVNNPAADILVNKQSFAGSENMNGTGIVAIDLSSYSDSSVNSGISTLNGMPVSLEITKNAAANAVIQVDTFSVVEMTVVRDSSGVLTSFI
jgi:hypothetical protein